MSIDISKVVNEGTMPVCPLCGHSMKEPEQVIVVSSGEVKALAHVDCTLDPELMGFEQSVSKL